MAIKDLARKALPDGLYLWLANRYRGLLRLVAYPQSARVGDNDYDIYWDNKAKSGLGHLSSWRRKRAEIFTSLVEAGDRVLDLGVGDGALLRYMIDHKKIDGYYVIPKTCSIV